MTILEALKNNEVVLTATKDAPDITQLSDNAQRIFESMYHVFKKQTGITKEIDVKEIGDRPVVIFSDYEFITSGQFTRDGNHRIKEYNDGMVELIECNIIDRKDYNIFRLNPTWFKRISSSNKRGIVNIPLK